MNSTAGRVVGLALGAGCLMLFASRSPVGKAMGVALLVLGILGLLWAVRSRR